MPVRSRTSRSGPLYAPASAMSAIWTGSRVTAMRPADALAAPDRRAPGARATTSSSRLWVARKQERLGPLVVLVDGAASVPASWLARATIVLSTVSRSSVELTAWLTSPSACSSSTERVSSPVRACSSLNSRAFSMAMTAWSAKVSSRAI